jgi:SAM-dependent methyltransferase
MRAPSKRAPGIAVFDQQATAYDRWFDDHPAIYRAEVKALRRFVPTVGLGLEIGAGSGRFAVPLGVTIGVEPAGHMAALARCRGVPVCRAIGEALPCRQAQFDFALLVTVICFVPDVPTLLGETRRVLRQDGVLIIGFIDGGSELGQRYESRKAASRFYQGARFYSSPEVAALIQDAGFTELRFCQTLFGAANEDTPSIYDVRDGYGAGGFVVVSARNTAAATRI